MGKFVEGVKTLFTGAPSDGGAAELQQRQIAEQQDRQRVDVARQQQTLQAQESKQEGEVGRAVRSGRGRRLLLASSGEAGLPDKLGG